jgi:3-mercaptopyruvate sulfurtransferase SseA
MSRRAFWLVALALLLAPPALGQVIDETTVPRMTLADFKKSVDAAKVLVVDVRDAGSYAEGHVPGAINVPFDALQAHLATLKASKKAIVTYCA